MTTNVTSVTKHFPSAEGNFSTTTSGATSPGASSVSLNSVAGYADGETVVFVIDPTDSTKKQVFTGTISTGTTSVTGVVWTSGTNQSHISGATVVDYATATHISMVSKGILVEHDQDGTHSGINADTVNTGSLTVTSGTTLPAGDIGTADLAADAVTNAKIADAAVLPEQLVVGAGTTWTWPSWIPTWTGVTVGNGTVVAKYIRTGNTIDFYVNLVFGSTTSITAGVEFTLPVTAHSDYASGTIRAQIGLLQLEDSGVSNYSGLVMVAGNATRASLQVLRADTTYAVFTAITTGVPYTPNSGDYWTWTGRYQAA